MSIAVRVDQRRLRLFSKGALRAFFDLDIGVLTDDGEFVGLATAKDWSLLERNDGSGFFVKSADKTITKNGEPVKGDDGYPKRIELFQKFFAEGEGRDGKVAPTKQSYQFFDQITEAAVAAYKAKGGSNNLKVPAGVGTSTGEAEPGTPFADDDLPF